MAFTKQQSSPERDELAGISGAEERLHKWLMREWGWYATTDDFIEDIRAVLKELGRLKRDEQVRQAEERRRMAIFSVCEKVTEAEAAFALSVMHQCLEARSPLMPQEERQRWFHWRWFPDSSNHTPGFIGREGNDPTNDFEIEQGAYVRGICEAALLFYRQQKERFL